MAGGQTARSVAGTVEFAGAFQPAEREFLAAQFGRCRFELLARSARGPKLARVAWSAAAERVRSGPSPLFVAPRRAAYVLDGAGSSAPGAGGWALVRVDGNADLEARYPGHFPGVHLHVSWRDRMRRWWPGALPGLIVAGFAVWLAAVVQSCRTGAAG